MATVKLGRRTLASLATVQKPTVLYDSDLKGFGLRLTPASMRNPDGSRTWIVEYRPGAGGRAVAKKRVSIGSADTVSPEQAREAAKTLLAKVRLGTDPTAERLAERAAKTIRELHLLYSAEFDPIRKPRTVELYNGYWNKHILPVLGSAAARQVTMQDVIRLHRGVGATHKATANRLVTLLAHFYAWAGRSGYVSAEANPCKDITRFGEAGRTRFLSGEELSLLGAALETAETTGISWKRESGGDLSKHAPKTAEHRRTKIEPAAADAIRLLLFTGARLREILNLEWSFYDKDRELLLLPDSKTGRKTIVLGAPASATLRRLWRQALMADDGRLLDRPPSQYVFPNRDLSGPRADLKRPWAMITRQAGLPDLRLHDIRHSFASIGVASDLGLPVIGSLLGHSSAQTTERYAHLSATPLRNATNLISEKIFRALNRR